MDLVIERAVRIVKAIGHIQEPLQTHATIVAVSQLLVILLHQKERHRRERARPEDC